MSEGDLACSGHGEFEELTLLGMLWKFYGTKGGPIGIEWDVDELCAQLVGVFALLWVGATGICTLVDPVS